MTIIDEAVENYDEQYDMKHNYGCFILFNRDLSNEVANHSNVDFERLTKEFRKLSGIYIAGATQGAITL